MLRNQFKIALRNLWKNKFFSLINILGLSLGMACCFLIILYCWHEFNYDIFHKNLDQLYRVEYKIDSGNRLKMSRIPPPVSPTLVDYFPEVEASTRFYPREMSIKLNSSQKQFEIRDVYFVDSTALDVFEFDFMHGDPMRALHQPEAVVLSDQTALKLFGKTDVVGEQLQLAGQNGYRVSAVVKAWPDNAHLKFDMLLPYLTMVAVEPAHARERTLSFLENNWGATHSYTYVKLKPNSDPLKVDERFKIFVDEKGEEHMKARQSFSLLAVKDIHLFAERSGPKALGNLRYLYLLLVVGILTLLIACINFVNLSTASSIKRAKEVGVRKVLGAKRSSLIGQFLGESFFLSLLSFFISLSLTALALPYLNDFTGIQIPLLSIYKPIILGLFISIFLVTGFLAGLYPAFFVSRFKPVTILKGIYNKNEKGNNTWLRKGLITLQFLVAIGFIGASLVVNQQIRFLNNQSLGFNQELVLSIPLNSGNNINAFLRPGDTTLRGKMNNFDESLSSNPNIKAVTQCSKLPGFGALGRTISSDKSSNEEHLTASILAVDYDFTETFELELLAGRDFDASFGIDHESSFLINEQTMKTLGWESPDSAVGSQMVMGNKEGKVIGVLKDFHFQSLRTEINPLVMEVRPGAFGFFAMRINNNNIAETLRFLEEKWKTAFPSKVFEYSFLEEALFETYQSDQRLAKVISYFAFISIFISCFGLFGLAAMMTQQRFKEIGIRKILGASTLQILQLISRDFIQLIIVAMLIAIPLIWYFVNDWLQEFAYSISFPWWTTIASGVLVLLVAFCTISVQSIKAALTNPVEAIRDE